MCYIQFIVIHKTNNANKLVVLYKCIYIKKIIVAYKKVYVVKNKRVNLTQSKRFIYIIS